MIVMAIVTIPFYPSVKMAREAGAAQTEAKVIGTALSYKSIRGRQREFLHQLEMGLDLPSRDQKYIQVPFPVSVSAPSRVQNALEEKISVHAKSHAPPDCTGCVRIEWVDRLGWSYKVIPGETDESVDSFLGNTSTEELEEALKGFIRESLLLLPAPPRVIIAPEIAHEALAQGVALSVRFGTHMILGVAFLVFPMMVGGSIGLGWDRNRNNAALEPLVFAYHPPWVAYTGKILSEVRFALIPMMAATALVWLYGIPVHWPFLLSVFLLGVSLYFLSSVWGLMATVLFHNPRGRAFAKIAMSPITFAILWAIRLTFVWAAMKAFQPISFIERAEGVFEKWDLVLWAIPAALALTYCLALVVNKRMGVRREGLREAKFQ